ncbi:MAG: hypothetical protein FWD82_10955, partial [Defluviitaleaceae bacterium]|nr:hypothetical protein [Defluviitaleaceae bacterium]
MKFLKQRKTRFLALLLSGTMLATAFTAMPVSASNTSATASSVVEHFEFLGDNQVSFANEFLQNFYQEIGAVNASDIVRRDALSRHEFSNDDRDALLTTLAAPMGAIGFEGEFSLDNPDEMILVWVSFRTPSSLALRLLAEDDFPRARFSDEVFEATALEAHDAFDEQLATLMPDTGIMALSSNTFEIWGRYSLVFNGVLMNVPMGMVEAIASLPEVFAVTPEVEAVLIGEVEDAEDNADMIMAAIESLTPSNEQELTDEYELIDDELTNDDTEYYSEDDYEILDNEEDDDDDEEAAEEVVATHVDAPIAIMPTYQSIQPAYLLFHPEFNRGARDLFELDDIHLGVTTGSPV